MAELYAGASRVRLEPPIGIAMAGYGRRTGRSAGIHDDLAAQAIVIADGARKAAIVTVDVLALGIRICDSIARQVAAASDIPADAVMVCATHTHSGPLFNIFATPHRDSTTPPVTGRDLEWEQALPEKIARAVLDAHAAIRPAAIRAASARFGLGTNRRMMRADGSIQLAPNYAGVADHELKAVGILDAGAESPIGFLLNYACHGVVLCEDNLLYSRDWPGFAVDTIEGSTGPRRRPIALFTQGACGNIDPVRRGSFETAAAAGREAAKVAESALAREPFIKPARLVSRRIPLRLKLRDLSASLALARANARQTELALANHPDAGGVQLKRLKDQHQRSLDELGALEALHEANRRDKRVDRAAGELETHMTILAIGGIALVGIPGELFAELGLAIKANRFFSHTLVIGYCNDLVGYLPTREAYALGGYEVETSRVAQGSGEAIVYEALSNLREMAAESRAET